MKRIYLDTMVAVVSRRGGDESHWRLAAKHLPCQPLALVRAPPGRAAEPGLTKDD